MDNISYGMVGGDLKALIGEVHRKGLAFDPRAKLVSGCFSIDDALNVECAEYYGVACDRIYYDYSEMAVAEAGKIDFVIISTPNHLHYSIAKKFMEHGIAVMCEKPLCFDIEEAKELAEIANEKDLLFAVNYCYSGYPMIKIMKDMITSGDIGEIISVNAEYTAGCFLDLLHQDEAVCCNVWRSDPSLSGISNTCGDDGTHVEHLVHYVTGLEIKRLMATIDRFGKKLDFNNNIIVQYENGAHGAYWFSQVACGKSNEIVLRVFGTTGGLEWSQVRPDDVIFHQHGKPTTILSRGGQYFDEKYNALFRLPFGHPEGYYVAQANIYRNFLDALEKKKQGKVLTAADLDFPSVEDGVSGVEFVHAVIKSGDNDSVWIDM